MFFCCQKSQLNIPTIFSCSGFVVALFDIKKIIVPGRFIGISLHNCTFGVNLCYDAGLQVSYTITIAIAPKRYFSILSEITFLYSRYSRSMDNAYTILHARSSQAALVKVFWWLKL